ncbi:unnamed protein product [Microthlaspi erraticum]|uniref:Uncharacterized protein n=1 Tax=Microthlaspi erraticum TaxID=1685480 RepID=A0A6D2K1B1_9BRAS|nr:unnamed protein product [Microthlaspi erraticum]
MLAKHGQDIDGTDGQKRPSHYTEDPSHDKRRKQMSRDRGLDTQQLVDLINNEPMGRSHLIQEDRIKEEMLILNEPITFSYPAAWGMDQWEGNLRGRLCWQISFVCKIVMGNLRGRLCRQILFMQAHMLSMTPMWKDHGRLSRQIFRGSCGYSSEAREALPQNRGCSQAHSRTSEPNRIGSVEAVHEGRKTRRITWSAALAEYGTI